MQDNKPTIYQRNVFRAEVDLLRVLEMISEEWTASGPGGCWHIGEVCWWQRRKAEVENLFWEDGEGRVAGFSNRDDHGYFELLVASEHIGTAAHLQMVRDLESRPILPLDAPETEVGSRTVPREDDAEAIAFIEHDGYTITDVMKVHMLRKLDGAIEPATVASGFRVRSLEGDEDIPARLAVHSAIFGGTITEERYRNVMALPGYRRDLDLAAVAPDGTFAATCLFWLDAPNRLAQIEPVGTVPEHRMNGTWEGADRGGRAASDGAWRGLYLCSTARCRRGIDPVLRALPFPCGTS